MLVILAMFCQLPVFKIKHLLKIKVIWGKIILWGPKDIFMATSKNYCMMFVCTWSRERTQDCGNFMECKFSNRYWFGTNILKASLQDFSSNLCGLKSNTYSTQLTEVCVNQIFVLIQKQNEKETYNIGPRLLIQKGYMLKKTLKEIESMVFST